MTTITDRFKTRQAQRKAQRQRPTPEDYRPYHTLPAFNEGVDDYMAGRFDNPYDGNPRQGLAAQAWDRGSEYAMRVIRHGNGY
jgi:hypothetical protein